MRLILWASLLLPWVFVPFVKAPFTLPKTAVFLFASVASLLMVCFKNHPQLAPWRNKWAIPFLLILLAHFAYFFWVHLIIGTETLVLFHWFTLIPTIQITLAFLLAWALTTHFLPSIQNLGRLIQWMCISGFAISVYAILQYLGMDPIFRHPSIQNVYLQESLSANLPRFSPHLMVGAFGHVSELSSYLAVLCPLFLIFKEKQYLVFLATSLLVIFLSGIIYAQVAAGIGLTVYVFCRTLSRFPRYRVLTSTLAAILVATCCYGLYENKHRITQDERFPIWQHMAGKVADNALLGHGLGSFERDYRIKWQETKKDIPNLISSGGQGWAYSHNEYLQGLYELGLFGVVPLIGLFASAFRRAWKKHGTVLGAAFLASGAAFMVISAVHISWHTAPLAFLGIVIWSVWETEEVTG